MAERLIVKNFGPLKDIDIELKDVNVFIGPTSSGKSTLAKLVAIFKELIFIDNPEEILENKLLKLSAKYNIDNFFLSDTSVIHKIKAQELKYENGKISSSLNSEYIIDTLDKHNSSLFKASKSVKQSINQEKKIFDQASELLDEMLKLIEKGETGLTKEKLELLSKKISEAEELMGKNNNFAGQTISEHDLNEKLGFDHIVYIPAERAFISMVANSLFNLINSDVLLSRSFKLFGANFEKARNELKELNISILNAKYKFEENINKIYLSGGEVLKLEQTSSGMQALIPMMLVVKYFSNKEKLFSNIFIIEEPELNLYPTMQKALVEFLVENCTKNGNKLIITTHSPYILTALDNLIQAGNVVAEKPHLKEEVTKLVPEERWLDFNRVSAYYVADGTARSILDHEMKSIGANNIDDVSEKLGTTFDELLNLRFQES